MRIHEFSLKEKQSTIKMSSFDMFSCVLFLNAVVLWTSAFKFKQINPNDEYLQEFFDYDTVSRSKRFFNNITFISYDGSGVSISEHF